MTAAMSVPTATITAPQAPPGYGRSSLTNPQLSSPDTAPSASSSGPALLSPIGPLAAGGLFLSMPAAAAFDRPYKRRSLSVEDAALARDGGFFAHHSTGSMQHQQVGGFGMGVGLCPTSFSAATLAGQQQDQQQQQGRSPHLMAADAAGGHEPIGSRNGAALDSDQRRQEAAPHQYTDMHPPQPRTMPQQQQQSAWAQQNGHQQQQQQDHTPYAQPPAAQPAAQNQQPDPRPAGAIAAIAGGLSWPDGEDFLSEADDKVDVSELLEGFSGDLDAAAADGAAAAMGGGAGAAC